MFPSEPEVSVLFSTNGGEEVVAEVVVPIRGYRTLKACSKADASKRDGRGTISFPARLLLTSGP